MEQKGCLASLFDVSFSSFVTTKIVRAVYILWMVMAGVLTIAGIIAGFREKVGYGILALVLSPVAFIVWLIVGRVYCELAIVTFRIAEYLRDISSR